MYLCGSKSENLILQWMNTEAPADRTMIPLPDLRISGSFIIVASNVWSRFDQSYLQRTSCDYPLFEAKPKRLGNAIQAEI